MRYFKVCPADLDVDDPMNWMLAYADTYRNAAIEHFKYLEATTHAGFRERDMIVTLEVGGIAKVFRVHVRHQPVYSADEMVEAIT